MNQQSAICLTKSKFGTHTKLHKENSLQSVTDHKSYCESFVGFSPTILLLNNSFFSYKFSLNVTWCWLLSDVKWLFCFQALFQSIIKMAQLKWNVWYARFSIILGNDNRGCLGRGVVKGSAYFHFKQKIFRWNIFNFPPQQTYEKYSEWCILNSEQHIFHSLFWKLLHFENQFFSSFF